MEIAFINLTYHKKSKSSDWFIKEIKKEFSVMNFTYDADPSCVFDILDYAPDLVICWQVDFLVPWFVSRKIKAISVPMADACENMPNEYFKLSGIYGSISMTSLIYDRMTSVGNVVSPLIYAPKPNFEVNKTRNIFAFLGVRKDDYELPLKIFDRLKRKQLKCHLHNSIDQTLTSSKYLNFDSNYFEDKNDLDSILLDSNFYICPREVEGIGLSYINAMEIGCIPIGSDGHGMHDYINNGTSGILFKELNDKNLIKNIDKELYFSSFIDDLININVFKMRAEMHHEMTIRNQLMKRQMASVIQHLQRIINLDEAVVSMKARRSLIGLFIDPRRVLDGRYVKTISITSSILNTLDRDNFLHR